MCTRRVVLTTALVLAPLMRSMQAPCDEKPAVAVVGVTNARVSRDSSSEADGPCVELGTRLPVVEDAGAAMKILLQESGEYWIHRIYLCTPEELRLRTNAKQIPDAKRITFVGAADDGQDAICGYIPIRDGRIGLVAGQALCFDQSYVTAHQGDHMDWMGLKGPYRTDSLYLITNSTSAVELPAWPRDRQATPSSQPSTAASTAPPEREPHRDVDKEPTAAWLKFPPSGLLTFGLVGDFESPPTLKADALGTKAWQSARRLVTDDVFFVRHPKGDFNVWAGLTRIEASFRTDETPHTRAHRDLTITPAYLVRKYGEPSHVGSFKLGDGEALVAYWFGPVCVTAKDRDSELMEIGGWPSRLLYDSAPTPREGLPAYAWRALLGKCSVEVRNPNPFPVLVGFRSDGYGFDCPVEAQHSSTCELQPGRYEVCFVFGNKPEALFQGDPVELSQRDTPAGSTVTKTRIDIVEIADGNCGLRRIK